MDTRRRRAPQPGLWLVAAATIAAGSAAAQAPPADNAAGRAWTTGAPSYFDPFDLAWRDGRWWVTGFGGVVAKNYLSSTLRFDPDFGRTYSIGATLGREFARWEPWFRFEWEVGAALQLGREWSGDLRAMPMVRFVDFPWNHHLHTTAAIGWGLSWMTRRTRYEQQHDDTRTHRLNSAMAFELTFAAPARPDWAAILRIQHRSGMLGLWNDHGDDIDFVTVGVKHRF